MIYFTVLMAMVCFVAAAINVPFMAYELYWWNVVSFLACVICGVIILIKGYCELKGE